jgi:hypothetical protein
LNQCFTVLAFNFSSSLEKVSVQFKNDSSGKRPFYLPLQKLSVDNRALFVRSYLNTSDSQDSCDTSVSVSVPKSVFNDFSAGDWSSPYDTQSGMVLPLSVSSSTITARGHADYGSTLFSDVADKSIGLLVTGVISADTNESNPYCSWTLEVSSYPQCKVTELSNPQLNISFRFKRSVNLFIFLLCYESL